MLTAIQAQQQRRRALPSLRQQYQEYVLQRIEGYKNNLSRQELLSLGDEALAEMDAAESGQFLLTEVMLADWVDRLIYKRLGLQPYRRWSRQFRALRLAQRAPTHWGLDPQSPVTRLLPRLEPGDSALVLGVEAAPAAFLLAAYEVDVSYVGSDMTQVDQVESRVAEEALGHCCSTYVTPDGQFPVELAVRVNLVVFDTGALARHSAAGRCEVIRRLQDLTAPGGVHIVLPCELALAPEAILTDYAEWIREDLHGPRAGRRRPARNPGLLLGKPPGEEAQTPLFRQSVAGA